MKYSAILLFAMQFSISTVNAVIVYSYEETVGKVLDLLCIYEFKM